VTTTSVRDSGLLGALLPRFEQQTGIRTQVIAVGSGAALRMGSDANADALITHAPEGEAELVASGAVADRVPFMENYFAIVGTPEDPAGVRSASSPADAMRRIADSSSRYISRGDDSGTHRRELALLEQAGVEPARGWPGFASTGSGMGQTLAVAGERRAYALSDLGTFLAFRERIELDVLSRPDPALRNVYSVLRVDPGRLDPARAARAERLEAFLVDDSTQEWIGEFGRERFGQALFEPLHPARRAPP
jgi:tungstate transport system substrate-binding protein